MSILAKLRNDRNLTQSQVANAVKISRSAYAMIELGHRVPRHKTMKRLADFFGITVDELFFSQPCRDLQLKKEKTDNQCH